MERLPMRKIKDVLRLRASGYSTRKIAASLGMSRTSARNYLQRAANAGFSWPEVQDVDEGGLERKLFRQVAGAEDPPFVMPDWAEINRELKRSGVTLRLLWEEYRACHPDDGYGYSAYCQHYRAWVKRLSPSMPSVPASCCGREVVRRLFRCAHGGDGSGHRHTASR